MVLTLVKGSVDQYLLITYNNEKTSASFNISVKKEKQNTNP